MALTRTQLRDAVRLRISDVTATNTDNWSDSQLNSLLYSAVLFLQAEIEKLDQHYFEEELDVSMGSTDTEISLPTGFSVLIDLRRIDNSQNLQFTIRDRREIEPALATSLYYPRTYEAYLTKNKIRYTTPLNTAHTVRVTYTKVLSDVALDGDSWDLHPYVEQAVIVKCALLALGSENNSTKFWTEEWDRVWGSVTSNLKLRQKATPQHVRYAWN